MYWASTAFIRVYKNSSETISIQPTSTWTGTWNESDLLSLKVTDITSPVVITFKQNCKVFGGNYNVNTSAKNSLTGSYSSSQTLNIRPDNNYYTVLFAYLD
jgi:hypothetical protein